MTMRKMIIIIEILRFLAIFVIVLMGVLGTAAFVAGGGA